MGLILGVRASGGKLPGDGMFRHRGNSCGNPKTGLSGGIFQLDHGVFKGPVPVDNHQDSGGAVAMDGGQALDGDGRH